MPKLLNSSHVFEVCPNLSEYLHEVENGGNKITPGVIEDVLSDFAHVEALGLTAYDQSALIKALAHVEATGKNVWLLDRPLRSGEVFVEEEVVDEPKAKKSPLFDVRSPSSPRATFDPLKNKRFHHKKNEVAVDVNFFALKALEGSLRTEDVLSIAIETKDQVAHLTLKGASLEALKVALAQL